MGDKHQNNKVFDCKIFFWRSKILNILFFNTENEMYSIFMKIIQ